MKILDNSRQIPKTKQYMASINYYDTLYGYLQAMSKWDGIVGHPRFVYKKSINYSRIANDLNLSRQTISKRFNLMLEGSDARKENDSIPPLIRLSEDKSKYELISLKTSLAMLVPQSTLEVLVAALNDNAISVYVYLFNRYYANRKKEFKFSYDELKNAVGIASNSNGNNYIITGILFILSRIGLLDYRTVTVVKENRTVNQNWVIWMTNEIEDLPVDIEEEDIDRKRWSLYSKMTGKERIQTKC